jgi:uncharacterized membrane protein
MSEMSVDLSGVHSHINSIAEALSESIGVVNSNLGVIDGKVEIVAQEQRMTKDRVEQLHGEFQEFVAADRRAKELQRALTEIVRVRQELEKNFGHYDVVRRTTTGILQATSLELVRQNTMHQLTEELMITTPRYWLAPALVALSSWIQDARPLAERAMVESIQRDDSKTSLFFSLVCRRARRMEPATKWLARYFQNQNPMSMDREVVVMLDGLANGVFGGGALIACSTIIEQWLAELEEQAGFADEQRKRWAAKLDVMSPKQKDSDYPTLKHSPTAPKLYAALSAARRNQNVYDFFTNLFTGELIVPPAIEDAVDELLDKLVTRYDDEELPLRSEERLLLLVKDEEGDKAAAKLRFAAEAEAFEEKTSFAALLTNSAMSPEQMGATRATQRYAVSRSREWILAAHSDLVARDRANMPRQVELTVGSWKGSSVDGSNEKNLLADMRQHYTQRIETAVAAVQLGAGPWIALVVGVLLGVLIMTSGGQAIIFGLIIAGAGVAFFAWKYKDLERVRENTRQALEKEHEQAARFLKACMAELTDYRREVAAEDAKSENVTQLLNSLSSPQFVLQRPEQRVAVA